MSATDTPLMQQYKGIKNNYPDMLLFFRMGDFYEMFFEDAVHAAKILNITLTKRGTSEQPIPMAGVPFHSVDQYLGRLVKLGESVVICEQIGESNGKGLMKRAVTRVVTPGTLAGSNLLEKESSCVLMAIIAKKDRYGYAWVDVSQAVFKSGECLAAEMSDIIARVRPAEMILPENMPPPFGGALKFLPLWQFDVDDTHRHLCRHFNVRDLQCFGLDKRPQAAAAAGALLRYAQDAYQKPLADIDSMEYENLTKFIGMTCATRGSLELTETLSGERSPTLYSVLNRCQTPMGARLLSYMLHHPPRATEDIIPRHEAVDAFIKTGQDAPLQKILATLVDIERIASSIALYSARPRDLAGLRHTMTLLPEISDCCRQLAPASDRLRQLGEQCAPIAAVQILLESALATEPAATTRDGGVIAEGYHDELDTLRRLQYNARDGLDAFTKKARQESGIDSLRVEYNRVQGFFIEIPKSQAARAPAHWQRRQTLKNAERFITSEIKQHEEKTLAAEEKARALERSLYDTLLGELQPHVNSLRKLAATLAELDMLAGFAATAKTLGWCRPIMLDETALHITGGRHPVVESQSKHFVANDLMLDEKRRLHIITGPNMGGKSTYLRQAALIVILACCGSFVPADEATIGGIGRIFTRIGAADDLAGGRSTFMVEMTETAEILHHAAADSLVLLDEIGRGTSTYDGLSLAWALAERLLRHNRALTLFATHYFELTAVADAYPEALNAHLSVAEHGEEIVFLHRVQSGAASRSYGLQVARLAGVPTAVIDRARTMLKTFEQSPLPLFTPQLLASPLFPKTETPPPTVHPIIKQLQTINPDELSPRAAHELLYTLKKQLLD